MIRRYMEGIRETLVRFWEDKVHFIEIHYLYIGFLIFFTSGLYYCQPGTNWNYIEALFMATTGSTNTGLVTVAMSELSTYQILIMFFTSFIASHITISYVVLMVRKHYFSKRFEDVLLFNKARRMREEIRRKEKQKGKPKRRFSTSSIRRGSIDLESGSKQRNTGSATVANSINEQPLKRFPSHSSTASSPVRGVKSRRSRRRSIGNWMTNPNDIRDFFREIREEQNKMMDKREAEAYAAVHAAYGNNNNNNNNHIPKSPSSPQPQPNEKDIYDEDDDDSMMDDSKDGVRLERQMSNPTHPFQRTSDPNDLRRVTSATTTVGNSSHAGDAADNSMVVGGDGRTEDTSQQGIAFAGNVEQQREIARRRLEQDRRFEELMEKISREVDIPLTDTLLDSSDDEDEEAFQEIMRQPIDKSQLTRQQRYRIGGIEYRALDMLSYIVPIFYVGSILIGGFGYRIFVACNSYTQDVLVTSNPTGPVDAWLFSFFQSMSGINNLGISILDASMVPFQNTPFPLIVTMIQILIGNTAYAILLRFIIWVLWKITPHRYAMRRETFRFLLNHPRRCYTTLFPATQTWWLLIILVAITLIELICFLALNYWLPVLEGIPWGSRFIDGLFQSIATRNAGFTVTSLSDLNPGTQLVYIVAMYISVYPVAISMRNSNVYQERALGIFRGDEEEEPIRFSESELNGPAPFIKLRRHPTINSVMTTSRKVLRGPDFFVLNLIQRQLTSDICWVISAIFVVSIVESQNIMSPSPITMMTVIYECVSAFGNVGASTGYPNSPLSQVGQYHTLSKLVIILLMYRGRHRGLPLAIDRAVLLPSEEVEQREVEDLMLKRRNTSMTNQSNATNMVFYTRSSTL